jgi:hypothetical protein
MEQFNPATNALGHAPTVAQPATYTQRWWQLRLTTKVTIAQRYDVYPEPLKECSAATWTGHKRNDETTFLNHRHAGHDGFSFSS